VVDIVQGQVLCIGENIFIDNDFDHNAFGHRGYVIKIPTLVAFISPR
jgi:hypothetical protein